MRAVRILRRSLGNALWFAHATRIAALWFGVETLLRGGRLWLTALGRDAASGTTTKHNIKRIDRLLGNEQLHAESLDVYRAVAHALLASRPRPVVIVDWTKLCDRKHALVAAVPLGGRAQIIYAEVHPESRLGKPREEKLFLKRLQKVIPAGCTPIVTTDAGFRNRWFADVGALGWDYVGRLRGRLCVREQAQDWVAAKTLFACASGKPKDLGDWLVSKTSPLTSRLVLFRSKRRGRHAPLSKVNGTEPVDSLQNRRARKSAREPWVLATSLQSPAKAVVRVYRTRMTIEESFRDAKSPRFGWSMAHARSEYTHRLANLLLIGALAQLAATLVGMLTERQGLHRSYQANTRKDRVLSWTFLGRNVIARAHDREMRVSTITQALASLVLTVAL